MNYDTADLETKSIEYALERCPELTDREREVFELLGRGQSNRQIAAGLEIAEGTVRVHVRSILVKLGLQSRLQAGLIRQLERWRDGQVPCP